MPIGLQQLKFMVNLAYRWPDGMTLDEAYEGRHRIPSTSQRLNFADSLIARGWVDDDDKLTLTVEGWEVVVQANPKFFYKQAWWWWHETVRPQVKRHFYPRGPLSEPIKT